jgi:PmbA protein
VSWNELFSVIFPNGISALNVQENRSVYKGRIGSQVANEALSIVDDGTLPKGFGTAKTDDEGVPRQRTPIIETGVLSNILYDNYTAKRENRESTGNASRQLGQGSAYANQPMIRPSNLVLSLGAGGFDDLLRQMGNGVLVKGSLTGALHSNVITGDFSVNASNAFKVENGQVAYPLKPCTIAGNLYEALNSVTAIGSDTRSFRTVLCPSLIIDKIVVST